MKAKALEKLRLSNLGLLIASAALLLSACIAPVEQPQIQVDQPVTETADSASSSQQLTVDQLKNATYSGIYEEPVTLTDGMYEGEPFVEGGASRPTVWFIGDVVLQGDLTGDVLDDAAVLLVESSGGSGVFDYIGAQTNQDGQPIDAGTVWLGDRNQIISAAIEGEQVVVDMVTQGPEEPMCCGTLKVRKTLALQDGMLAEVGTEELGYVALDDLMGTSWLLTELAHDQPALPDGPVTAIFADGQVSGSAGCNSYSTEVSSAGGQSLTVGPIATTMMACPDPIMNQEMAYLAALQTASQWSYLAGQLAITYQNEDGSFGRLNYSPDAMAEAGDTESNDKSALVEVSYQCAGDITVMAGFDNQNDTVLVTLPEETLELPRAPSGSGARYSDGKTTFWSKGDGAFVQVDDQIVIEDCQAQSE